LMACVSTRPPPARHWLRLQAMAGGSLAAQALRAGQFRHFGITKVYLNLESG